MNFKQLILLAEDDFMAGMEAYETRDKLEKGFNDANWHTMILHNDIDYDIGVNLLIDKDVVIDHQVSKNRQLSRDVFADVAREVRSIYVKDPNGEFVTDQEILNQIGAIALELYNEMAMEYREYGDWE